MVYPYPILRQKMAEHNIKIKDISSITGITRIEVLLSLCGFRKWGLTEAISICCFLKYPDVQRLFVRNHFKQ